MVCGGILTSKEVNTGQKLLLEMPHKGNSHQLSPALKRKSNNE